MRTLRALIPLLLTLLLGLAVAGCNTLHGVGRDLELAGEWIQDEAEEW